MTEGTRNKSFPVGDTVKVTAKHYLDDVLTNPTTCVITVEEPDGTDNTPSVNTAVTGIRSSTFVPTQSGYHRFKAVSTGTVAGVREGTFYVHTSGIS